LEKANIGPLSAKVANNWLAWMYARKQSATVVLNCRQHCCRPAD